MHVCVGRLGFLNCLCVAWSSSLIATGHVWKRFYLLENYRDYSLSVFYVYSIKALFFHLLRDRPVRQTKYSAIRAVYVSAAFESTRQWKADESAAETKPAARGGLEPRTSPRQTFASAGDTEVCAACRRRREVQTEKPGVQMKELCEQLNRWWLLKASRRFIWKMWQVQRIYDRLHSGALSSHRNLLGSDLSACFLCGAGMFLHACVGFSPSQNTSHAYGLEAGSVSLCQRCDWPAACPECTPPPPPVSAPASCDA